MKSFNPWNTAVVLASSRVCGFTEDCFPEQPVRARAIDASAESFFRGCKPPAQVGSGFYVQ
jgi:hypothetical protein